MRIPESRPSPMFRSQTPQRMGFILGGTANPESGGFERSGAMILGPGSYDPNPPRWLRDVGRNSTVFASTRKQREPLLQSTSSEIDLMHTEDVESMQLNTLFSTSPGASGQRWTASPRTAPYFHARSRPYSFGRDAPRGARDRDLGHDQYYAMESRTMSDMLKGAPRTYNTAFRSKLPMRLPVTQKGGTPIEVGPGSYSEHEEVCCGGIRVEGRRGPSSCFAPAVGGRY
uniref:Uncharacterized protein n=1 Tax=Haptolina brevifila TaxID=156173 RepID=A0A7S2HSV8_9EUKA|mmetsp:Transcript_57478/g.114088  ORF Transcript_57478/g.114088 Transcript_57478/m.114088 type:complete len:229 (+) Transcript_57478:61-747(+)|eukprot:CAMPEP_0174754960 /NCGR_PEP_ID=MMETSP1094-20130205/106006_1 /TAXON_ID=156173 /ORGANISM="Chrysochromulina brevifilum, Strain UTEX LB 985" /LENGTH=228 /DNA_ID=CAMNT_0015960843 /DNA_START=59 /DNA_END=745 /DNA_ORIENTATION=+